MFIEVGPASIVVTGRKGGESCAFDKSEVEGCLVRVLAEIGDWLPVLRQKGCRITRTLNMSPVARSMVEAVMAIDGSTMTPMAAVAGAVADTVKERLLREDIDFLSVNNGGDISLFSRGGRTMRIGIGDIGSGAPVQYVLKIDGIEQCGVATSGFGGRSFTLGLADTATVIAATGAIADAAATMICNETNVETDRVIRKRGAEMDPCSDIGEEWVTVEIGALDDALVGEALDRGIACARQLKERSAILDAVITLRGRLVTTVRGDNNIYLEADHGDQEDSHHRGRDVR